MTKKGTNYKKTYYAIVSFFCALCFCQAIYAITPPNFPTSTLPERVSQSLAPTPSPVVPTAPSLKRPTEPSAVSALGKEAESIKFKLTKLIIEGNCVISTQQLLKIYQKKLNTTITVAELMQIVDSISAYYRNKGYIISRAVLPPQHIKSDGVVHVRIIEGYIDKVYVLGQSQGPGRILRAYGRHIAACKPLRLKVLEKYLLLANQLPGVQVRSVLEPSKTATGASDLNLIVQMSHLSGYLSYDNYGTRYLGPQQGTISAQFNSIFRSSDTTGITYVNTMRPQELKFIDVSHDTPLGCNGARLYLDFNESLTKPLFALRPFKIDGKADNYYIAVRYPLVMTRRRNLTVEAGFAYLDSQVTTFDFPLYTDHIRPLRFIVTYNFSDKYRGANNWVFAMEKGFPWLAATTDTTSLTTSRFGGTANFFKLGLQINRLQPLCGPFSFYFRSIGQYSFQPLLAAEQFGVGGATFIGRGYDPSEIIGDRGVAYTLEMRADFAPGKIFLQALQPYVFYDQGAIWNIKNVFGVKQKQSLSSTGIGSRFYFTKNFSGNLMITQPLTKQVAALQLIGDGRCPRVFFSIVGSVA